MTDFACSEKAKGYARCPSWCGNQASCPVALSRQAPAAPAEADPQVEYELDRAFKEGMAYEAKRIASPAAPTPADPQALLGWTRYEKARKLNPAQWAELHQRNLRGENFDDMIDALPATTQPVQQDAPNWPDELFDGPGVYRFLRPDAQRRTSAENVADVLDAVVRLMNRNAATPPAEKQAAPSGEDKAIPTALSAHDKRSLRMSKPETVEQIEAHTAKIRAAHDGLKAELAEIDRRTCERCCGSGKVKHDDFNPTQSNCPHCDGEGLK